MVDMFPLGMLWLKPHGEASVSIAENSFDGFGAKSRRVMTVQIMYGMNTYFHTPLNVFTILGVME